MKFGAKEVLIVVISLAVGLWIWSFSMIYYGMIAFLILSTLGLELNGSFAPAGDDHD